MSGFEQLLGLFVAAVLLAAGAYLFRKRDA